MRKENEKIVGYIVATCLVVIFGGLTLPIFRQAEFDPVKMVFGDISKVKDQHFIPMAQTPEQEAYTAQKPEEVQRQVVVQPTPAPVMEHIPEKKPGPGEMYQYTDKNGVLSFTDNPASVPKNAEVQTRTWAGSRKIEVRQGSARETAIIAERDRVYVPVTIRSAGRSKEVLLLLDTGATNTMIYSHAAEGLSLANARQGRATLADGRVVANVTGEVEAVEVGPAVARGINISIMSNVGDKDHQGLLGMNFLKNFHYTLDLNRKVIRWN